MDALKADAYDVAPVVAGTGTDLLVTGGLGYIGVRFSNPYIIGNAKFIGHITGLGVEVIVESYTTLKKEELKNYQEDVNKVRNKI